MCSHVHVSGRVNASIGALQTLHQYWKMVHTLYEFYTGYRFWRWRSGFAAPFCYPSSASSSFVSSEFVSLLFLWEWHYVLPSLSSSDAITCLLQRLKSAWSPHTPADPILCPITHAPMDFCTNVLSKLLLICADVSIKDVSVPPHPIHFKIKICDICFGNLMLSSAQSVPTVLF